MEASRWVTEHLPLVRPGGHILDLACGHGRHTGLALQAGYRVTAADIVFEDFDFAADRILLDLESDPPPRIPGKYDGVIVTNYLHRPLIPQLPQLLRPGGILIYETFMIGNEEYGRPANPDFLLEADELRICYESSLELCKFWQGRTELPKPAMVQRYCGRKPFSD
ncbi:MAG: class I SAM-dependent methyltransferase [Pseudomonadales bacterium]|nr:class I SAM-dependent methyltransferase [Pseudomonadales bacterium]